MGCDGGSSRSARCWRSPPPPTGRPRPGRRGPRGPRRGAGPEARGAVGAELLGLRAPQADQGRPQGRPRRRPGPGRPADARRRHPGRQPGQAALHHPRRPDRGARPGPRAAGLHRQPARTRSGWRTSPTARRGPGIVYVAFVIDVFSRRIVGWKAARSMHAAAGRRRVEHGRVDPARRRPRRRRSATRDAGVQYTSIAYTDRLDDIGAAPSIGTVGDSFDNAMAESVIGLFKTELHRNPAALAAQRRPLARPRRPRDRHLRMGRVVQRGTPPRRARRPHPSRGRTRPSSTTSTPRAASTVASSTPPWWG